MPMTVEEFQVAQLYTVGVMSRENTNGDTGVKIVVNEPFTNERGSGQYTHKIYQLGSKLPKIATSILPESLFKLHEKAWNCYPYCRTEYSVPALGDRFSIIIETVHLPDNGCTENAHNLTADKLKNRKVTFIDIATSKGSESKPETDPTKYHSERSGRGPLYPGWAFNTQPVMCCYKLATIDLKMSLATWTMESMAEKQQFNTLLEFARKTFCLTDQWYGMTMEDIRALEEKIKSELDALTQSLNNDDTASQTSAQ